MNEDEEFIPTDFPLYEFDPPIESPPTVPSHRWLDHWNGLIGEPAQSVMLGWTQGTSTMLVDTDGGHNDDAYARYLGLFLAIGNSNLPTITQHYRSRQERLREMELYSQADDEWGPPADGDPDAVVTTYRPDFIAGYKFIPAGCIFLVAIERVPFRGRVIEDPQSYAFNPTRRFRSSAGSTGSR